ncbi:hypothetical protein CH063_01535 [Colletotrichum higginsianum]|uniref:Uncharacterized protein n=2 Tax=Colletotrichum higginsianum TaxID=80884 RepID=H1V8S9_COLHI|nr:hypothetical protein CH63R_09146 [Colletotrichum higginsianum IMI 349063]OBR07625.1 hypothetical protein CH63R_09146 [Colletotrichum higginsianum IMI 349063]TIC92474.1 hypothetical protein CH35J_010568 [Colletotrichum higginsianum]GJC98267.1 hypothetical protein ColKHC_07093 [Colletotrichum higginsianum]CCF36632.1 hypothetical protein CH063_01535 [Colletotrichum higginsianum]
MSDEDGGLFSIAIDDSDDEGLISEEAAKAKERPRDWQSEEEFQELRATYRVNVQDGDIWQKIELPLAAVVQKTSKPALQELLHAVEELYFLRRFEEAAGFARRVLDGSDAALDRDTRQLLGRYEEKCRGRMEEMRDDTR